MRRISDRRPITPVTDSESILRSEPPDLMFVLQHDVLLRSRIVASDRPVLFHLNLPQSTWEDLGGFCAGLPSELGRFGSAKGMVKIRHRYSYVGFLPAQHWLGEIALGLGKRAAELASWPLDVHRVLRPQYSRYAQSGHYDWHRDSSLEVNSLNDRLLTVMIQLSRPGEYEGGAFEVIPPSPPSRRRVVRIPQRSQGTVAVFPSTWLHRVCPVTAGVRRSIVCWLSA